jgi:hypothetical protein
MPKFDPVNLSRNEIRRTTLTIRLALQVAQEALQEAKYLFSQCYSVFTCAGGNTEALEKIFTALAASERTVSPHVFTHSVHNAPAGYWSIALGSQEPSTSLGAYDASFAAGLLEAGSLSTVERRPVLLVAYDVPPPSALLSCRPLQGPFGMALLLNSTPCRGGGCRLRISIVGAQQEDRLMDPDLESLRINNPAARSLPLLRMLAKCRSGQVLLPYLPDSQLLIRQEV